MSGEQEDLPNLQPDTQLPTADVDESDGPGPGPSPNKAVLDCFRMALYFFNQVCFFSVN